MQARFKSAQKILQNLKKEFVDISTGIKNTINWNLRYLNK